MPTSGPGQGTNATGEDGRTIKPTKMAMDKKPTWHSAGWTERALPAEGPGEPDIPLRCQYCQSTFWVLAKPKAMGDGTGWPKFRCAACGREGRLGAARCGRCSSEMRRCGCTESAMRRGTAQTHAPSVMQMLRGHCNRL